MGVAQYTGRQYDVLAFRGATLSGPAQLTMSMFDSSTYGEICTGIQSLAQRWLLTFLTEVGTMKFKPNAGTNFMRDLRRGRFRTESDILDSFSFADLLVSEQLRAEETDQWPDDERFSSAKLTAIALLGDSIALDITINSRADVARTVVMPLPITV